MNRQAVRGFLARAQSAPAGEPLEIITREPKREVPIGKLLAPARVDLNAEFAHSMDSLVSVELAE